jgi:hypothetical protein
MNPDMTKEEHEAWEAFHEWDEEVTRLVLAKQGKPFADYKKNRWRKRAIWLKLYKEGLTPAQAANLWGLNHQKNLDS